MIPASTPNMIFGFDVGRAACTSASILHRSRNLSGRAMPVSLQTSTASVLHAMERVRCEVRKGIRQGLHPMGLTACPSASNLHRARACLVADLYCIGLALQWKGFNVRSGIGSERVCIQWVLLLAPLRRSCIGLEICPGLSCCGLLLHPS